MKISTTNILETKQDLLVLGLFSEDSNQYKKVNPKLQSLMEEAIKDKRFELEFGKTFSTDITNSAYKKILLICLGKKKEITPERVRRVFSKAVKSAKSTKLKGFTTDIAQRIAETKTLNPNIIGRCMTEGIILSNYKFDKYKKQAKDKVDVESAAIQWSNKKEQKALDEGIKIGRIIAESTNYAKNLVNEPSNVVNPTYLEQEAKKLAKLNKKIKVKVLNKEQMKKLGMNALLGVSSGSVQAPKLIIIEYSGASSKPIALVGKGITYDSGGYNLKPTGYLEDMKIDMGGAAAVLGTMKAISQLNPKKKIIGVIPSCENMISGTAYRPGDVIKAYNGKTIEIGNTDAEGRLILADALAYTDKNYKPEIIIDLATLTGAVMVALGFYATGMVGTDDKLQSELEKAGEESYDRVWRLPFFEEYQDNMKGEISDLNNVSTKMKSFGGAITAGVFLSKFVEKAKWAHLDIAGTAYLKEAKEYNQKNASGAGVRLLSYWLMNI